ncbi:LysR substrate-binding domain-containing protein [Nocardioides sp. InS609-2]|uniref:LysR substrate-binding domain-containing protein n=1 Tax=Nocardioides sp. InS609-2 TaxID=2760705 RepID=UPI0020C002A2|nr:LysR substrate-binding domain-containing protein [Nocardioides sp. InS609-2]
MQVAVADVPVGHQPYAGDQVGQRPRPPFDTALLQSRVVLREPLMAIEPADHPLASLKRPLTPQDFEGQPVIAYDPQQSRYFDELSVRFLANAHPRIEQRVHQVLTAMLLVAADRGLALAPASAASLAVPGVVFKELVHGGGDTALDADPERPVELYAVWSRESVSPVVRRVLEVISARLSDPAVRCSSWTRRPASATVDSWPAPSKPTISWWARVPWGWPSPTR